MTGIPSTSSCRACGMPGQGGNIKVHEREAIPRCASGDASTTHGYEIACHSYPPRLDVGGPSFLRGNYV